MDGGDEVFLPGAACAVLLVFYLHSILCKAQSGAAADGFPGGRLFLLSVLFLSRAGGAVYAACFTADDGGGLLCGV